MEKRERKAKANGEGRRGNRGGRKVRGIQKEEERKTNRKEEKAVEEAGKPEGAWRKEKGERKVKC